MPRRPLSIFSVGPSWSGARDGDSAAVRLFVAAELPDDLRARLGELQRQLRSLPLEVRWVPPEGIHLTLKFLGDVAPARVGAIGAAVGEAAAHCAPFTLTAGGVGVFPERGAPRILWVGLEGDLKAAGELQQAVETHLSGLGFARESRPFQPHLTLGRVKGPGRGDWKADLDRRGRASLGGFGVRDCVLFESRLDPSGAVYSAAARFPLASAGA